MILHFGSGSEQVWIAAVCVRNAFNVRLKDRLAAFNDGDFACQLSSMELKRVGVVING